MSIVLSRDGKSLKNWSSQNDQKNNVFLFQIWLFWDLKDAFLQVLNLRLPCGRVWLHCGATPCVLGPTGARLSTRRPASRRLCARHRRPTTSTMCAWPSFFFRNVTGVDVDRVMDKFDVGRLLPPRTSSGADFQLVDGRAQP